MPSKQERIIFTIFLVCIVGIMSAPAQPGHIWPAYLVLFVVLLIIWSPREKHHG